MNAEVMRLVEALTGKKKKLGSMGAESEPESMDSETESAPESESMPEMTPEEKAKKKRMLDMEFKDAFPPKSKILDEEDVSPRSKLLDEDPDAALENNEEQLKKRGLFGDGGKRIQIMIALRNKGRGQG